MSELAWAAGFFDGEGSTYLHTVRKKYRYLGVAVEQKDPRPLERFAAAIGHGRVRGPYGKWGMYNWRAEGAPAQRALDLLWPYLSEPKREQAQRVREELRAHS